MVNERAREDSTVFINNVESMEYPEQRISTFARVDCADRFYDFFPEGPYFSEGIDFRHLRIVVDGKIYATPFVSGVCTGNEEELIGQIIKSSPKAMQQLGDQGCDLRSNFESLIQVKACVSSLQIEPRSNSVRASFGPSPHLTF